jgi:hypothetical protein
MAVVVIIIFFFHHRAAGATRAMLTLRSKSARSAEMVATEATGAFVAHQSLLVGAFSCCDDINAAVDG